MCSTGCAKSILKLPTNKNQCIKFFHPLTGILVWRYTKYSGGSHGGAKYQTCSRIGCSSWLRDLPLCARSLHNLRKRFRIQNFRCVAKHVPLSNYLFLPYASFSRCQRNCIMVLSTRQKRFASPNGRKKMFSLDHSYFFLGHLFVCLLLSLRTGSVPAISHSVLLDV